MRFAELLAAAAAHWVQPAYATAIWTFQVSAHVTGTNTPYTPGGAPSVIPVDTTLNFLVDLAAFDTTSNLTARLGCVFCDPTGLGGRAPAISGVVTRQPDGFTGTNFSYSGGPAEYTPTPIGAASYLLSAPTFSISFIRSSDGVAPIYIPAPEPATWAMMLVGFGLIGFAMRRRANQPQLRLSW
jgi:hypothetical protein